MPSARAYGRAVARTRRRRPPGGSEAPVRLAGGPDPAPPPRCRRGSRVATVSGRRVPPLLRGLVSHGLVVLIVVTGAAVRLTGSGLGCPDWPVCYQRPPHPAPHFHPLVEFGNRMVTVVLTSWWPPPSLAALRRRPFRRDLVWLSVGLVAGVLAQAVMGGIVVYTKLNPYLVMVHFLAVDAAHGRRRGARAPLHRDYAPGPGRCSCPDRSSCWPGALVLLALVLAAGTATTGAGPHAGRPRASSSPSGSPWRCGTWPSSTPAWPCSSWASPWPWPSPCTPSTSPSGSAGPPGSCGRAGGAGRRRLHPVLHPPPAPLVEVHVLGATVLVIGVLQFFCPSRQHRRSELGTRPEYAAPGGTGGAADALEPSAVVAKGPGSSG